MGVRRQGRPLPSGIGTELMQWGIGDEQPVFSSGLEPPTGLITQPYQKALPCSFMPSCLCACYSVCLFSRHLQPKADHHSRAKLDGTHNGIQVTFQPHQPAPMYPWTNYLSYLSIIDSSVKWGKQCPPLGRIWRDDGCKVRSNVLDIIALTECHHGYELYAVIN